MKTRFKYTESRSIQFVRYPVFDASTEELVDHLEYPRINGVTLVPLSDADKFGLSSETLREMIKKGDLKAYEKDGSLRKANAKTNIYFDPYQYYNQ